MEIIMSIDKMMNSKESKFKYEPVNFEQCNEILNEIKSKFIEIGGFDKSTLDKIDKISKKIKFILEQADQYCCSYIRANGLFTVSRFMFNSCRFVINEFLSIKNEKDKRKFLEEVDKILDLFNILLDNILVMIKDTNLKSEQEIEILDKYLLNYSEFHRNLKIFRPSIINRHIFDDNNNKSIDDHIEIKDSSNSINSNVIDSFNSTDSSNVKDTKIISTQNTIESKNENQQFNSLPLISVNLDTICDGCYEIIAQPTVKRDSMYGRFFASWLDKEIVWFFKFFTFLFPFYRAHFYQYPKLLFSTEYRAKFTNKLVRHSTLNCPFDFWDMLDSKILILLMKCWTRDCYVQTNEVRIPKQNSIIINTSPVDRLTLNHSNRINFDKTQTIKSKFLRPSNKFDLNSCDKLILHLHGGGFVAMGGDSHEIFLRPWIQRMQIPILTVDYQLKKAFPAGFQDCFDVYLWLRKAPENEIRSILGYYPRKIVIAGDSAGGNFALSIALVLNDLRTDYKSNFNVKIEMPNGLMLCYAPFLVQLFVTPSRSLSAMDLFIPLSVMINISEGISGLIPEKFVPSSIWKKLLYFLFPSLDQCVWLNGEENQMRERFKFLSKNITSPYLSTLYYDKYDQLTDVKIHLISAEYCPFLDESITFAKFYKGPLKVDVMTGLFHGFLNLHFVDHQVFEATCFVGEKIVDMFESD